MPRQYEKENLYIKKVIVLCMINTIHTKCDVFVVKKQRNCEIFLKRL